MSASTPTGVVYDIQRYTVHDGPGIRTEVFLKGCPLRCEWCCSPESQHPEPELMYMHRNCTGDSCENCIAECPEDAISLATAGDEVEIDRTRCTDCGDCIDVCFEVPPALQLSGEEMTVEEVMETVKSDAQFYRQSGGGVTISGGEALQRPEFVRAILRECKAEGFHTCIDTSGYADWEDIESVLPFLDLIMVDLKHIDESAHRAGTGVSNEKILQNFERVLAADVDVIVRVPLIPGFNATEPALENIAGFIDDAEGDVLGVELQPYHSLGRSKYRMLDRTYPLEELDDLSEDSPIVTDAVAIFESKGLRVSLKSLGLEYDWDELQSSRPA